jgi:signal transduction protein with GAF and PtsI domain
VNEFSCLGVVRNGKPALYSRELFEEMFSRLGEGEEFELSIGPVDEHHTRKQENGFHAMIAPWAKEDGHAIEDLKRDLLAEIFGMREHVDVITGEVVLVLREPHTSKLSKKKYNELIERTLEIGARMGHVLEAPSEYRERKEREASDRRIA